MTDSRPHVVAAGSAKVSSKQWNERWRFRIPPLSYAVASTVGRRKRQEDAWNILNGFTGTCSRHPSMRTDQLLMIADGLGGHDDGDVASEMTVKAFAEAFGGNDPEVAPRGDHISLFRALSAANDAVNELPTEDPNSRNRAGSTLIAMAIGYPETPGLTWISVGDSYLFEWERRDGKLTQLNRKHTGSFGSVASVVGAGCGLGAVNLSPFPGRILKDGGLFILATDGIDSLREEDHKGLESIVDECRLYGPEHLEKLANDIVQAVLDVGDERQDNTTVIVAMPRGSLIN